MPGGVFQDRSVCPVSSFPYGNATASSGAVKITHDIQQDITGRNIVVIEDILDSGNTLHFTAGTRSVSKKR